MAKSIKEKFKEVGFELLASESFNEAIRRAYKKKKLKDVEDDIKKGVNYCLAQLGYKEPEPAKVEDAPAPAQKESVSNAELIAALAENTRVTTELLNAIVNSSKGGKESGQ